MDAPKWAKQLLQAESYARRRAGGSDIRRSRVKCDFCVYGRVLEHLFLNRLHPAVVKMRDLLDEGTIGRLVSVEGRMVTSSVARRDPALALSEGSGRGRYSALVSHSHGRFSSLYRSVQLQHCISTNGYSRRIY